MSDIRNHPRYRRHFVATALLLCHGNARQERLTKVLRDLDCMVLHGDNLADQQDERIDLVLFDLTEHRDETLAIVDRLRSRHEGLKLVLSTVGREALRVADLVVRNGLDAHLPDYLTVAQQRARLQGVLQSIKGLQRLCAHGEGVLHVAGERGRRRMAMQEALHRVREAHERERVHEKQLLECNNAVSRLLLELIKARLSTLNERDILLAFEDARLAHRLIGEPDVVRGVPDGGRIAGFMLSMGVRALRGQLENMPDAEALDCMRLRLVSMLRLTFRPYEQMRHVLDLVTPVIGHGGPLRLFADYCLLREQHAESGRSEYHALRQLLRGVGRCYSYDGLMRLLNLVRELRRLEVRPTTICTVGQLQVGMRLVDGLLLGAGTRLIPAGELLGTESLADLRRLGDWIAPDLEVRVLDEGGGKEA